MRLIFIIKIHILVSTCTFPVTHPGISKQLGLKPRIIDLQKYVVIRNYYRIKSRKLSFMSLNGFPNYVSKPLLHHLKSNWTIPSSKNSIEKNDIPEIIFRLLYTGKVVNSFWNIVWRKLNVAKIQMLNLECFTIQRKCHFIVISKISSWPKEPCFL